MRTDGLTKRFGAVTAVNDLTLQVPRGSIFGFLGPNGAGKTTTIHLLLGLLDATAGRAEVLGHDVAKEGDAVRAASGVLLEHHGLYERMTAEDNLELHARIWGIAPFDRAVLVRDLLQRFGLWERRRDRLGQWSKGMKTKLAVARALVHRPELLFLDEPTAGLDPATAAEVRDDLVQLSRRDGVTIFLTTHNLPEAEKVCDAVGVIHHGRLLAAGSPEVLGGDGGTTRIEITGRGFDARLVHAVSRMDIVASCEPDERGRRLVVHLSDGSPAAPLVRAVVEAGGEVEEVRKVRLSLEEVFLALTADDAKGGAR